MSPAFTRFVQLILCLGRHDVHLAVRFQIVDRAQFTGSHRRCIQTLLGQPELGLPHRAVTPLPWLEDHRVPGGDRLLGSSIAISRRIPSSLNSGW